MKLCPYPFSRMQTSNYDSRFEGISGTFIPCVPSWFTDDYYRLKREDKLEDIWNGLAAQELRRRMYEGDYSFCDRKSCQIPLFEVDELADKELVFNETPIPPENIQAIKDKNPIMPSDPSSLYLTSDFTCNLKNTLDPTTTCGTNYEGGLIFITGNVKLLVTNRVPLSGPKAPCSVNGFA